MIFTEEILEKGKSSNGGWGRLQLFILGIPDFSKGWKQKIIGKDFPEWNINKFLSLKNIHLQYKNLNRKQKSDLKLKDLAIMKIILGENFEYKKTN